MLKSSRRKSMRTEFEMKKRFVDFIKDFLETSAAVVLIFMILTAAIGKEAGEVSSLFRLGNSGIALESLVQMFALSFCICLLKFLFLSDVLFKSMGGMCRYILCFGLITVLLVVFGFCFRWISNEIKYWLMFLGCYIMSTVASILISNFINKKEDKKMNDALLMMKRADHFDFAQ